MTAKTKTAWVLSDGRPGHFNQSRGVIKALSLTRPLQVEWLEVRLRLGLFRLLQRALLQHTRAAIPPALLRVFYAMLLPAQLPDLIVSAGGRTSFANAWLARQYKIPNLFIGSLRGLPAELFSAVLTLEPIPGLRNNIVLQFPVSEITPDYLKQLAVPASLATQPCWTLLVGGSGSGYRYRPDDWVRLGTLLNALAEQYAVKWLICTTPRTGRAAQTILKAHIAGQHVADSCWFARDSGNKVSLYLAVADKIFVTEDSMTMLGEALASGKPVFSLQPEAVKPDQRYLNALQRYVMRGLLSRQMISELLHNPARVGAGCFATLSESPLVTLSEQLEQYI